MQANQERTLMSKIDNNNGKTKIEPGATIAIGIGVGVAIGAAIDNIGAGLAIGIAIGVAMAASTAKTSKGK